MVKKKKQVWVKVGERYGDAVVKSVVPDSNPKSYICECMRCGKDFVRSGQELYKYGMCGSCLKADRDRKRVEAAEKAFIGKRFGSVVVIGIGDVLYGKGQTAICRCDCGKEFKTPIAHLKTGNTKSCGHDSEKNLDAGRGMDLVEGTTFSSVNQTRKRNKNNASGVTGVSQFHSGANAGKWRAYIGFKGVRYELGIYKTMEEAIEARREAEEKYYKTMAERLRRENQT